MATVLLAEPSAPVASALRRYLEGAGHEVAWVGSAVEARRLLEDRPPAVLVASASLPVDGEALCQELRQKGSRLPVLLVYPPDEEHADPRATQAGADGCLVGPLKRGTVVTCVRLVLRLDEAGARPQAPEDGGAAAAVGIPARPGGLPERRASRTDVFAVSTSPDFDFLKRLLLMEVKRSRRYRYPISLLLVELDRFTEHTLSLAPPARTALLAEALGLLTAGVRDIDVVVPFAESRFVAFLPHTPRSGARVVAERLRERMPSLKTLPGATASVGVAVSEPSSGGKGLTQGAGLSFGGLLREAGEALRRAQMGGGDSVVVAPSGPGPGAQDG
ncbi:diguanylate cyclase [Corallococcus llansteffanensis]|uniref:Diguanylate cyclase n=1 Tax=Corallococcus llansteffanensis TaxID=2316731 RepID=A0A3A8PJ04_9BACT|nr:diguanylate cyclase [Corallococcus llansteffanensis]RKH56288.1 diguanylate cyclase [Corallococcus llansteffanensis]